MEGNAPYNAANDVDSCMGSGSGEVAALAHRVTQCIPIPAPYAGTTQTFYFGYRFKASGGSTSAGTAICYLNFYNGTCATGVGVGAGGTADQAFQGNNWIQAGSSATSTTDATHLYVNCVGPAASGYYDQVYVSASTPGVPAF
jgi:hypothetical protein